MAKVDASTGRNAINFPVNVRWLILSLANISLEFGAFGPKTFRSPDIAPKKS